MGGNYDVIIIGGGIAGVTAGDALAEDRSVLIVEMEDRPGYHTTGRSASMFIESYGPKLFRALTTASRDFYHNPPGDMTDIPFLHPRDTLIVATDEQLPELEKSLAEVPILKRLDKDALYARMPVLAPDMFVAGAIEEGTSSIDVDAYHQGAFRRFKKRGGEIVCGRPVSGMRFADGNWTVEVGDESFSAPVVINAAGAWGDEIAKLAGAEPVGLVPKRRTACIVEMEGPVPVEADWPLTVSAAEDWYFRPEGTWIFCSPADATPVDPHDAWADDMDVAIGVDRVETATQLSTTKLVQSWAGLRTFAPDGEIVVGFEPGMDGFFWLVGQGGYGIQSAPAVADSVKSLIDTGELPSHVTAEGVTKEALSPSRFR